MVNNTLTATIPLGPGMLSITNISWAIRQPSTWAITSGNGTLSIKFSTDCAYLSAIFDLTFTVNYINGHSCQVTCSKEVISIPAYEYCTLTQGGWGQSGGDYCGTISQHDLLVQLLTPTGVTVGRSGNSYYSTDGSEGAGCVELVLPSSGPKAALVTDYVCYSNNNNLIKNVLLGQSLTLAINLRNSPALWGFALNSSFKVSDNSGNCGTAPDLNKFSTVTIPSNVISYLNSNYGGATVGSLMEFANDALGTDYLPCPGNPSLSDIATAAGAINEGFDECKWSSVEGGPPPVPGTPGNGGSPDLQNSEIQVSIVPNPFAYSTVVKFSSTLDAGNLTVDVYNLMGVKITSLFSGPVKAGETNVAAFTPDEANGQAMYFVIVRSDFESVVKRMIMIK